MWQCDNCGYTDEDGTTFEEDAEAPATGADGETVRYCPECGSDEVVLVDEDDDADLYAEADEDDDADDDDDDDADWDDEGEDQDRS